MIDTVAGPSTRVVTLPDPAIDTSADLARSAGAATLPDPAMLARSAPAVPAACTLPDPAMFRSARSTRSAATVSDPDPARLASKFGPSTRSIVIEPDPDTPASLIRGIVTNTFTPAGIMPGGQHEGL